MGQDRLQQCVAWATQLHFGQWREGEVPLPYICHPLEVLSLLRHIGDVTDEPSLCAAVLHDIVEETDATIDDVLEIGGKKCAALVDQLTRKDPAPEDIRGLCKDDVWQLKADQLIEEIRHMVPAAQTIKLCDRISNLREAKYAKKGKKLRRYVWQSWRILDTIPREVHPVLWNMLEHEASVYGDRP